MCHPLAHSNRIHGALSEIISGMSSLNMPPSPESSSTFGTFLSESDRNARHSMEHFRLACRLLMGLEDIQHQVDAAIAMLDVNQHRHARHILGIVRDKLKTPGETEGV